MIMNDAKTQRIEKTLGSGNIFLYDEHNQIEIEDSIVYNNRLDQWILRTNNAGIPLEWVTYRSAVKFHCTGQVAYSFGNLLYQIRGGNNAITRRQSVIDLYSIVATRGHTPSLYKYHTPPLSNIALFRRDSFICMYCGELFGRNRLSRDHVLPLSAGGKDEWKNVVTACRVCNNRKAGKTPEAAGMQLLAVPFAPTRAEYVYLQSRNILADQMEFLKHHFPRSSRLHRHQH